MKKFLSIVVILFVFISNPIFYHSYYALAEADASEVEVEIANSVDEQLANLDTQALENLFSEIANSKEIFGSSDFSNLIRLIISGDLQVSSANIFEYIAKIFFEDVISFLPYICLMIAISLLYSMVSTNTKIKSIGDVVHFVCFGAIVVISISCVTHLISITTACAGHIKGQMEVVFPLLLTLMTALGGNASVGIYQPAMAVLSGAIISLFTNILIPILTFKIIFTIISNISTNIKFNKFADFFGSTFKWIMGSALTIFTAFLSIQGLMAGSVDGISIRTAKYTIKSGVPLIGGFLSDGVSVLMLSCSLIKNAIGVSGLLVLFCVIIVPILKIIVMSLLMKLASAILEPIADARVTSFVGEISKTITMLVAVILGISFMYFIMIGLVMCSLNLM